MRYFTTELWLKINDCDNDIRAQAENTWNRNSYLYHTEFEITQKYLPKRFVRGFLERKGLHDYTIEGIAVKKEGRKYSCYIHLSNKTETVLLTMFGIKSFHINVNSFEYCILGELAWGYSEFEMTVNKDIRLSILCDIDNELQFEFESIKLSKTQDRGRFARGQV
jgi:hypothetical protein